MTQFQAAHREPDSAVRAIHHQPATEGAFADIPAAVDPRLRAALEKRGIARLYSHQAEAFDQIDAGPARGHRHADRQRQDALLQPAGAEPAAARPRRARHVPVPHQGAGRGSAPRVPARGGRDGLRHPRLHLRRRHAAGRAQGHPGARQRRAHQSRHAALRHPAAPHQVGAAISRTCATSSSTSCTTTAASTAAISPTCCAG